MVNYLIIYELKSSWLFWLEEITFKTFQRILNEEKPIDERALEEAFETLYNKDRKQDWSAIDYDRFRADMLQVRKQERSLQIRQDYSL